MAINFGWDYELIICNPAVTNNRVIPKSLINPRYIINGTNGISNAVANPLTGDFLYYDTIPEQNVRVTKLRISATISQVKTTGNPCEIMVYNLDDDTINLIKKDSLIILRAGYLQPSGDFAGIPGGIGIEDLPDLFVGQVIQSSVDFGTEDKIVRIICGEGSTPKRNSKISKSYPPMTTRLTVLKDLLELTKSQGVATGRITLPAPGTVERAALDTPLLTGYVAKGMLFNELERVTKDAKMNHFMALGKLYVEPATETTQNAIPLAPTSTSNSALSLVIAITPDMVKGNISKLSDGANGMSNKGGGKDRTGIQFVTWLNGHITVGAIVRLKDFVQQTINDDYNGEYKVTGIVHRLDSRSANSWDTAVTLEENS